MGRRKAKGKASRSRKSARKVKPSLPPKCIKKPKFAEQVKKLFFGKHLTRAKIAKRLKVSPFRVAKVLAPSAERGAKIRAVQRKAKQQGVRRRYKTEKGKFVLELVDGEDFEQIAEDVDLTPREIYSILCGSPPVKAVA